MVESSGLEYWIGFNRVRGIGSARLRALIEAFGDVRAAWNAPAQALKSAGLDRRTLEAFLTERSRLDLAAELAKLDATGAIALTWDHPAYPARLREIPNPPPLLYVRGHLTDADDCAVAIVGTRRASSYGREVARRLAGVMAASGATVVSGLARGIDAVAHQAALEAGGRTLAVLGSGVDVIYPPEHRALAEAVTRSGALVSDLPLGAPPEAGNFPARNRIIAGLSAATVVVEADETSGALLTAEMAAEQGRDVFAVPGSVFSRTSRGTNRLIRDGAHPVLSADEVLGAMGLRRVAAAPRAEGAGLHGMRQAAPLEPIEAQVMDCLSSHPVHIDQIGAQLGWPAAEVSSALTLLELRGLVHQVGGMNYVRADDGLADESADGGEPEPDGQ